MLARINSNGDSFMITHKARALGRDVTRSLTGYKSNFYKLRLRTALCRHVACHGSLRSKLRVTLEKLSESALGTSY